MSGLQLCTVRPMQEFATLDSKNRILPSNISIKFIYFFEMLALVSRISYFANGANDLGCYNNGHLIAKDALSLI